MTNNQYPVPNTQYPIPNPQPVTNNKFKLMKNGKTTYQESVNYLYGLQKYGIKFGLSKTSNLLKTFGNPHKGRRYIHIAGTNGKGSVAAFIASILKETGLKVGFYSSPHLVRFTERFKISGEEIDQGKAMELIEELRTAFSPEEPPTFFEATTAMALIYFARENTDLSIMEVGMGGRLDATNVITPLVSGITNISMEHQDFLGNRLLDIAKEKAGIIKRGVDVITAATQSPVIRTLEATARDRGAPLWRVGKEIRYRTTATGFHYSGPGLRLRGLRLGLKGMMQTRNAALALGIIEKLVEKGIAVSEEDIRKGLRNTAWPGRMHIVGTSPTILLDGGHNPAALRALAHSIRNGFKYRRLVLVIGVMADKEINQMLRAIIPLADYLICTRPVYSRAAEPEILMAKAAPFEKPGEMVPFLTDALTKAKEMADPRDLIVVCGSLFTVGEALTYFDPETY
ncbi:MAG: bifunctional folylpolyglutamate synthase/dihydrofolate synthase [Deltaproteobacteria bacterium]|uniref:tetrahydrofolate synthase n=1 Tax=Candidatus Desulfacyla euxinica TaxID=2841693 RepID=A0A8J6T9B9_9DELT|nr:bifunctional folylpolyglutamate synthase/dihydrofolate synthase [Candidatus Desulfacyla euxinica]